MRTWSGSAFKAQLLSNSRSVRAGWDSGLPADLNRKVVEDTADTTRITLHATPSAP